MVVALDEFPIHQVPLSMAYVATSDRNTYDRYYFCGGDTAGETYFVTGLGVYPNLGVIDAFVTVRRGDNIHVLRTSSSATGDRLHPKVGPYSIDVTEPLRSLRVVAAGDAHGVGADLTWTASHPAIDEPYHLIRRNGRVSVEAQRFAQVGRWSGELRVGGETITVDSNNWYGARDRSWGIRPSGEAEPAGRVVNAGSAGGFWWVYFPMNFDDYSIIVIVQEDPDGTRTLNEAVRVWGDQADPKHEQLGWPEFEFQYRSGTRHPEACTIHVGSRKNPMTIEATTLNSIPLNCGPGYGSDPDWNHGLWKGDDWVEGVVLDLNDPAIKGRIPYTLVDHMGRFVHDGNVGYGLFEHGTIGRHDPTGFADFMAVAP